MSTTTTKARVTSFAPQFLVDDLERTIGYYQKIGFSFDEPWDGFYAIGHLDGLEVHLKEAPKNQADRQWRRDNEHLDAAAGVDGIEAFYEQCVANGVTIIITPLAATAWGTKDFYRSQDVQQANQYCSRDGSDGGHRIARVRVLGNPERPLQPGWGEPQRRRTSRSR